MSSYDNCRTFTRLLPARKPTFVQCKVVFLGSMQHYWQVKVITGHKNDFVVAKKGQSGTPVQQSSPVVHSSEQRHLCYSGQSIVQCVYEQSMNHISLKIDLDIMQRHPLCQRLVGDFNTAKLPESDAISGIYQSSYSVIQHISFVSTLAAFLIAQS